MRRRALLAAIVLVLGAALGGCTRAAGPFSEESARDHIRVLAGTIGSRPVGTAANARARDYIVEKLRLYGFDVRVQQTDGRRPEIGRTAHVNNIIATLPGSRREAVGLVAHYDSSPYAPGAADDGLGVAVALEAARLFGARTNRTWTLFVLLTDAEEAGLLGAAGLMTERDVRDRLLAYLNIEATGSGSPSLLFQTGPDNPWLTGVWAAHAAHPRGGSFGFEIYKRLPNDTDFSVLRQQDIPGLNFATVGDSYSYHTARDTADRLSPRALRDTGDNVVAIVDALDRTDVTRRTSGDSTYFDIDSAAAVSYGSTAALLVGFASTVLGAIAWVRVSAFVLRTRGIWQWILTAGWTVVVMAAAVASMVVITWALRASREVYHPWYAHPDRLMFLLVVAGTAVAWGGCRALGWLPPRMHGPRHPALTWSLALPVWIGCAIAVIRFAPSAAYLWTIPLLAASIVLLIVPLANAPVARAASLVVLAVSGSLWLREVMDLFRFIVALFGRLPLVTPAYVYAGLLTLAATMIAPPLIASVAGVRQVLRPKLVTALWLIAVVIAAGMAYAAPAYTREQPLRRTVRALQGSAGEAASWEIASVEPGIDLGEGAPAGWNQPDRAVATSIPWGALSLPFVFRTSGPSLGPPPLDVGGFSLEPVAAGVEVTVRAIPKREGLWVSFVLPAGIVPVRTSLPGVSRLGQWTATYVAPPSDGIIWRASFKSADGPRVLEGVRLAVTDFRFPGGEGWQRLPAWLPQERAVWSATATWVIAPVHE